MLRCKVEEESETIVVCPQRFLALSLLVIALKELKLGEPLIDRVCDFRPTGFVLVLNDRDICIKSFEICLLALLRLGCRIEVVANGFPGTGTVSE